MLMLTVIRSCFEQEQTESASEAGRIESGMRPYTAHWKAVLFLTISAGIEPAAIRLTWKP